jgi:hypothetical protein
MAYRQNCRSNDRISQKYLVHDIESIEWDSTNTSTKEYIYYFKPIARFDVVQMAYEFIGCKNLISIEQVLIDKTQTHGLCDLAETNETQTIQTACIASTGATA